MLQEIEKNLLNINGVSNCRVIGDNNNIDEIHIINQTSRSPKQIARDVESYIKTAFKINLNHKKISIVNLDIPVDAEDTNEAFEFGKRISFENLSIMQGGRQAVIELELGFDGKMYKRQQYSRPSIQRGRKDHLRPGPGDLRRSVDLCLEFHSRRPDRRQ
jgi:hypothetical protein